MIMHACIILNVPINYYTITILHWVQHDLDAFPFQSVYYTLQVLNCVQLWRPCTPMKCCLVSMVIHCLVSSTIFSRCITILLIIYVFIIINYYCSTNSRTS